MTLPTYKKPKSGWKLLGKSSTKTQKGEKLNFTTYIMYLSPAKQNSKGIDLCPFRTKGCTDACLNTSGRGKFTSVQLARINKANFYVESRHEFLKQLCKNIDTIVNRHNRNVLPKNYFRKFCIRLNGTSDINFLKQKIEGKTIFETYPDVIFYDYTKNHYSILANNFPNYDITFSRHSKNEEIALNLVADGFNSAFVFEGQIPKFYKGFKVISGDETDLRFLDQKGVIVGLTYKKSNDKDIINNAFVIKKEDVLKYGSFEDIKKVA